MKQLSKTSKVLVFLISWGQIPVGPSAELAKSGTNAIRESSRQPTQTEHPITNSQSQNDFGRVRSAVSIT